MEAAIGLFIEKGFDATTTTEIAEAADVSPRTLFRYFPTKDTLLFHDLESRLATITERLNEQPPETPVIRALVTALTELVTELDLGEDRRALLEHLRQEKQSIRRYQRSMIMEHGLEHIVGLLARREARDPGDLVLRAQVATFFTCFELVIDDWFDARGGFDFEQTLVETLTSVGVSLRDSL